MTDTPAPSLRISRPARATVGIVLLALAATIIYPYFFLITSSLRTTNDYLNDPLGFSGTWSLDNFVVLWNSYGVGEAFLHTLAVSSVALVIEMLLAILAGFAMAKYPVPGAKVMTATFVAVMLIPGQVLILPIYLMLAKLGLIGDYSGLVLVYVATGLPFAVFFLSINFRSIPAEILEAARLDGAGFFRTLFSIVVPNGMASIATLAVLQLLGMWNELIFASVLLPDSTKSMLTPTLAQVGERFLNEQPLVSAGLLITSAVPLILLMVGSRYIMQGLASGVSR